MYGGVGGGRGNPPGDPISPRHRHTQDLTTGAGSRKHSLAPGTFDLLTHARLSQLSTLTTRRAMNVEHPLNRAATVQTLPSSLDDNPSALDALRAHVLHESNNEPTNWPK